MDHGMRSDKHPENDRASTINGVKEGGVPIKPEGSPGRKIFQDGQSAVADYRGLESKLQALHDAKLEDLPDEIKHITDEIMPLGLLLSRLAQFSHGKLQELIISLAAKPLPELAVNGGANGAVTSGINGSAKAIPGVANLGLEDTSPESLEKKTMVLNVIKDLHSRWVKALVITEWSRNAEEVGKLIDLRQHLADQMELYTRAWWDMIRVKDEMAYAKVPSPDLKTALEVLSTGAVHWMPDLGYLPEPPLKTEQKLYWLNEIDVSLHMRLQIQEFENLPYPWRQYEVHSGRVTFNVPGEFEVDLTIADEDFETSQFWFLDYRQTFQPAPPELSANARAFIEAQVNTTLQDQGLLGCYNFLHELTLTTKIGEFERQANMLSQSGLWFGTLRVERLNRCLSIQYWAQSAGSPHWILLGVHSGKAPEGLHDSGTPSHLTVQWFRDGKRVDNVDIPFDVDNVSAEDLVMTVISRHIEYLLSSIYRKLLSKPRYARREGKLGLHISKEAPLHSSLRMQLLGKEDAVLRISPWTGTYNFLEPPPAVVREWKQRFNMVRNPAEEGAAVLERFRCFYVSDRLKVRAAESDWDVLSAAPLPLDEVKNYVYKSAPASREGFQGMWMRNTCWDPQWFAMLSMSLGGDHWWLVEISTPGPDALDAHVHGKRIKTFTQITPSTDNLHLPRSFFANLAKYGANIMSQIKALRTLHQGRISHVAQASGDRGRGDSSFPDKLTTIHVRTSDILAPEPNSSKTSRQQHWAQEFITVDWKGLAPIPMPEHRRLVPSAGSSQKQAPQLRVMVEAKVAVTNRVKLSLLQHALDRDVLYDHRLGQFTLRFQPEVDSSFVPLLRARMQAIDRLVEIVDALRRGGRHIVSEKITLREIKFTYDSAPAAPPAGQLSPANQAHRPWRARLDLARVDNAKIVLEAGNPHLRVIDFLQAAANSPTLGKIPAWLILTLPLYRALERMQDSWDAALVKAQGACYVFHKTLDWVTIRFAISGAANRRVHLDIKPRDRAGDLMWHIYRPTTDANANNENDEFNKILKQRVWSASGNGFKGLVNSAAASRDTGIENVLALISDSIMTLVGTPPPPQSQQQLPQRLQAPPPPAQDHQPQPHPIPGPGPGPGPQAGVPHPLQQPQQPFPPQLQQHQLRLPPQRNMLGQGQQQHQGGQMQGQQQQQRPGNLNKNNAPVVVLD